MPSLSHTRRALAITAFAAATATSLAIGLPASAAEAGRAYVSDQSGRVSVVDLADMHPVDAIDAYGKEPRGIGLSDDGKYLVTANRDDANISIIDRVTGQLIRHVEIGANPEFVRVRGNIAFVTYEPGSKGGPPPSPAASGANKSPPDGDDDDAVPAHIAIVDLTEGRVLRTITGGRETEGIEFSPDGKSILVTNEVDQSVTVHSIATGKRLRVISTKAFGSRPRGIKVTPDGKGYVVTLEATSNFIVIDNKFKVVKSVATGFSPYGVAFDRSGTKLFVAAARSKQLQVFDAKTYALIKSVPTGDRCWHFTFTPDDTKLLVACGRSDEVVVIDAATLEPVQRIVDKQLPWGIVTYPKSFGSLDAPG